MGRPSDAGSSGYGSGLRTGGMSEFLDELARGLAQPMPRRRVLRLIGAAVIGVGSGALAPAARARPSKHMCYRQVAEHGWKFCTEETKYCFPTCCPPERRCKVGPRDPKNGCPEYTTCPCKDPCGPGLRQCCGTDEHCSWPGKDEGFPQNGLCCPRGQLGCGVDGPRGPSRWTFCCPRGEKCCGRKGKGHCCSGGEGRV